MRYIHTNTVGVAISRNIAIREAAADIVVFTDDDCVCDRDWLQAIIAEFAADPQALGVYGRVVPYGKAGSSAWDCVAEDGDMICPALIQSTSRAVVDRPAIPHLVLGGGNNMSFRKEALRRVGLFNEMLGPGSRIGTGEDTEFSYRLLFNRCRLIYSPQPLVEHDNWMERAQFVHHMKVAMRVQAAVFTAYALRFDALSVTHLLRTAWYLARNRMGIGSAAVGTFPFRHRVSVGHQAAIDAAAAPCAGHGHRDALLGTTDACLTPQGVRRRRSPGNWRAADQPSTDRNCRADGPSRVRSLSASAHKLCCSQLRVELAMRSMIHNIIVYRTNNCH